MKILGIYLPAFHETELNNRIWKKGFVEWDNVKSAQPLYAGHNQPLEPINNNYYDLSHKEAIIEQIKLANKYHVDGFIFYHYWFGDKKMTLEKPAEILKNEITEKIEYCFCWANHSWITNWHDLEPKLMVEQKYGDKNDWLDHIKYLYSFFKDNRYIKIDDRPVLFIYNMSEIPNFQEMLTCFNEYLSNMGMKNLYIVEYISSKNRKLSFSRTDAIIEFEPLYTTFFDVSKFNLFRRFLNKKTHTLDFQEYDNIWKKIIKRKRTYKGKKIYKGCFTNWDNSPRKGNNAMIIKSGSPEKFKYYFNKLIETKRKDASNDYIIINAWNEWSEGAILEPTKKDGYKYLEAVKEVVEQHEKK